MSKANKNSHHNENEMGREELENLLFGILRTFYQFERIEVSTFDLSYDMIYILKLLWRLPSMRVTDIADEMKIKVFSATRLVDQLEGRGLVKRGRDKNDGRIIQVSITAKGKRMVQKIEDHALRLIASNMGDYGLDEIKVIEKTIKDLNSIMGIEKSKYLDI